MHSHYDTLKIALDAPAEVVRAAYRVFAARHHPDRAGADELALMQRVNEAYRVLSDPAMRAAHDAWLRTQRRRRATDAVRGDALPADASTHATGRDGPAAAQARSVAVRASAGIAAPAPDPARALPDAAWLMQCAQRRRVAAAYAAHAPRGH